MPYVTRLRKLAETCEYADPEEEVRDQFVCSCFNTKLREKFLRTDALSVEKIIQIGNLYENSKSQATEISGKDEALDPDINTVNYFQQGDISRRSLTDRNGKNFNSQHKSRLATSNSGYPKRSPSNKSCFKCGKLYTPEHLAECPALHKTCNFCGIMGHFESVCFKKIKSRKVREVSKEFESDNSDDNSDFVNTVSTNKSNYLFYHTVFSSKTLNNKRTTAPIFDVNLNDSHVPMIGDTRATCSCINVKTFKSIQNNNHNIKLLKTKTNIITFGDKRIKPLGKFVGLFEGNNNFITDTVYVMSNNSFENIMSKDTCVQLGYIQIKGEKQVHVLKDSQKQNNTELNSLLQKYDDIEGKDWRKELEKLLFSYRNSPHTTTGYSPSLLFFSRPIKTGLPEIIKPLNYDFHRTARQNELTSQRTMERNFNTHFKPKHSDINIGDIVLLKQRKRHQLTPKYSPIKFAVIHKKGSAITVRGENGSIYTRDVSTAKHFRENSQNDYQAQDNQNNHHIPNQKVYPRRNRKPVNR